LFHYPGAVLERLQQVAVPALEIFQDLGQLAGNGVGIEGENSVDNMICPRLVGRNGRTITRAGSGRR
jgi:hypothetical protein